MTKVINQTIYMKLFSKLFAPKAIIQINGIPLTLYRGDKTELYFTCQFSKGVWNAGWVDEQRTAWVSRLTFSNKDLNVVSETLLNIVKYQVDVEGGRYFTNCPAEAMNIEYDKTEFQS